jgi:tetratricopeptide (TPR) repeat protein
MGDIKIYNIGSIETAQFVAQSPDYQILMQRISEKQEMVEFLQEKGETDRALKAAAELEALKQEEAQFKENILRLYETFTKIEIDTERLAQAKAFFDRGEFREADAILNAERMAKDLDRLIERGQQLDQEKAAIDKNRVQLGNEFLIKARLRATFYDQANHFEEACAYFEESLRAARTPESLFEYAWFLQEHNDFIRAQPIYTEALTIDRDLAAENPHTYLPDVATTLNNLAILQKDQNDYVSASSNFTEALAIRRDLAAENPRTYLPDVATTLNNLAVLQKDQNDYVSASSSYSEALTIDRDLAAENPHTYLPDVATTLNNLAILQKDQNDYVSASISFTEALTIYRDLAAENPRTYLPDVAMTLNNLANLQSDQNDYVSASSSYSEALAIRRDLAAENPRTYLPRVATMLNNLAILQKDQNDYVSASSNFTEALAIRRELAAENPRTYLPDVAMTLNNLAVLQSDQNDYVSASGSYTEALAIYRDLAAENPRTYLPDVAMTLLNLSIFYLQAKPDKTRSANMAREAIEILQNFQHIPQCQQYTEIAFQVLQANGVATGDISQ